MHWLQVIITPIAALVLSAALYLYGRHRGHAAERRLVEQFICDLYTWPERPKAQVLQREGAKRRARIRFQNRSCVVTLQGTDDKRCGMHPHQEYGTLTPTEPDDDATKREIAALHLRSEKQQSPAPPESEGEWVLRHFLADLGISAEDLVAVIELERDAQEADDGPPEQQCCSHEKEIAALRRHCDSLWKALRLKSEVSPARPFRYKGTGSMEP